MIARPLLRFDTFGHVDQVVHDIDVHVPHIFLDHSAQFVLSLKKLVKQTSSQFGWETVVLSVNQGMPREEMELFLSSIPDHRGPIVIDPTLQNPQNNFYEKTTDLKADSERLMMMCENSNDVLVILYGTDGISHLKTVQLLQARLRMMDMTFEMLKVDLTPDPRHAPHTVELNKDAKRLELARRVLGELNHVLDVGIRENLDWDGNPVSGAIFEARNDLHFLMTQGYEPGMQHNLQVADLQLRNIPEQFSALNLAPIPQEQPRLEPQARTGLHHTPHGPRHDFYYDENNPRPKY